MTDTAGFLCVRCEREGPRPLAAAPFPSELGSRILSEICTECWEEWKRRQMLLINHYGLNLRDERAREFLYANLRSYLFEEGEPGARIDTSEEGTVDW